jgi:pimeloyl-ACP methyl ester carboxylesterase
MGCTHAMWMAELAPESVLSLTSEAGECMARGADTRRTQTPRAVAAQERGMQEGVWDHDPDVWAGWPAYQWSPNKWWATPTYASQIMYKRYVKNFPYNRNAHRDEMLEAAKTLLVPTTALIGDRDEVQKISVLKYWKRDMPQARLVIVAGAIHDIQNSQPEQFVELLKACSVDPQPNKPRCPND